MTTDRVIETEGLGRSYGRRWAVNDLDLIVPRGAVFGFLGLNGAGKSTTIRMLMGLIRPHSGTARVLGFDPRRQGVELKRRVGYVPEVPGQYSWMTVDQLCAFVGHYRPKHWDSRRATELMDRFSLPGNQRLDQLSKGQRAKTSLVLAMAFDPEVLILDEPTSGLDPVARREFVEGVLADYQESGNTVFVSSHLVNELAGLIDHVGILHEGRLALTEPTEDFLGSMHRVRLAFEGDAPRNIPCLGCLRIRAGGRDAVLSVRTNDVEAMRAELAAYQPISVDVEPMDLEDAFVEFVGGLERGTL